MSTNEAWLVLVVDDSPDDRAEVRRLLLRGAERRVRFLEADTGARAQQTLDRLAATATRPDVIVLDFHLPDGTASELLETVFRGPMQLPLCPVVVLTGSVGREVGPAVLRAGAQDFLSKQDMTASTLTRAVENALERFRLSSELAASETRLRLALEASRTGLWEWETTTDRVWWSPECYPIHGLAEGDFAGTAEHFDRLVHPDDRQEVWRRVRAAADDGTPFRHEFRIVRPGGEVRWVQNLARAIGPAGGPVRMIGTIADISDRKQAEEALTESERRFRALADQSPVVMWVSDATGGGEFVNRAYCEFFGVGPDQIVADGWHILVHPDDRDYISSFEDAVRRRVPFAAEARLRRADGEWRTISVQGEPRHDGSGRFVGMIGVNIDVTDQREAAKALREAARQKDDFIAMLAHELRNPLAPVRNAVQILRRCGSEDTRIAGARDIIDRQVAQMTRLVDDLLDVARIARGKIDLEKKRLNLQDVLAAAIEATRPAIEAARHSLVVDADQAAWVEGDPARLVQIVTNLLTNAAKFTPPGGHIAVHLGTDAREVIVGVRDTGCGIPREAQARVFELFEQVGATPTRTHGGLGIGLSLVKRLTEMHNGTVRVNSEGRDCGTEFVVTLPCAASNDGKRPQQREGRRSGPAERLRVLVIEEHADSAHHFRALLEQNGHDAHVAPSGIEAIRLLGEVRPDVAFVALGLPGIDGYGVAERIRASAGTRPMLVAMLDSGKEDDKRRAREAGFDVHIIRPVDHRQLETLLARLRAGSADAVTSRRSS